MKKWSIMLLVLLQIPAFSQSTQEEKFALLVNYMSGSFTSEQQATNDSAYFNIHLHMQPIWTNRPDGVWLYVEQAVAGALDKPYRQRIYHVTQHEGGYFESAVFEFENPLLYVGAYADIKKLSALAPEQLLSREGCSIILRLNEEGSFIGRTGEKTCSSSLRGATYATSQVTILADQLLSWDRGFNEKDEQVWGAEKGPYIFVKE